MSDLEGERKEKSTEDELLNANKSETTYEKASGKLQPIF